MSDTKHHGGLVEDLRRIRLITVERRQVLRWAFGATLLPLVGCGDSGAGAGPADGGGGSGGGGGGGGSGDAGAGVDGGGNGTCAKIPEETGGPYPGDGSNGPNVLNQSGIVRADIRSSFGASSGTAGGVPLTIKLELASGSSGCGAASGLAVYLWHCDQAGRYSLYSAGVTGENFLRGVQVSGADGLVSFTSIVPGCYSGRWPHIHFEVFSSLDAATGTSGKLATSQLALPKAMCEEAYAASGYAASIPNLAQISLASDNVFSDGADAETPTVTGNASDGYVATLRVPVAG